MRIPPLSPRVLLPSTTQLGLSSFHPQTHSHMPSQRSASTSLSRRGTVISYYRHGLSREKDHLGPFWMTLARNLRLLPSSTSLELERKGFNNYNHPVDSRVLVKRGEGRRAKLWNITEM